MFARRWLLLLLGGVVLCAGALYTSPRWERVLGRQHVVRSTSDPADFRGFAWGESLPAVQHHETAELLHQRIDALLYRDTLVDVPVVLTFGFVAGQLRWGDYACESDAPATDRHHRQTFERFYQVLLQQYQAPNDEGVATLEGDKLQSLRHSLGATQIDYALWYRERTMVSLFLMRYAPPEKLPTIWRSYKDIAHAWSRNGGEDTRVVGKL